MYHHPQQDTSASIVYLQKCMNAIRVKSPNSDGIVPVRSFDSTIKATGMDNRMRSSILETRTSQDIAASKVHLRKYNRVSCVSNPNSVGTVLLNWLLARVRASKA